MSNSFETKIEISQSRVIDRECKWIVPQLDKVEGIIEQPLWSMDGLLLAVGSIDDDSHRVIGSGVMVAPGLCLTATHVIEEMTNCQPIFSSFVNEKNMRIWFPNDYHAQEFIGELVPFEVPKPRYSDVIVLSCSPFSSFTDSEPFMFSPVESLIPKIGERLWTMGYRQKFNDGVPTVGCFVASGLVSELYIEGRGSQMKGPCVEVKMTVYGGMSGGPVFNSGGKVIGVISSGFDGDGVVGPTYVSLVWPSLLSTVNAPWPENYWPDGIAGLQLGADQHKTCVLGSARVEEGITWVKFSEQSEESMIAILQSAGVVLDEDQCISDWAYGEFEEYLEEEGLSVLPALEKRRFSEIISVTVGEISDVLSCKEVECLEGMEDLDIKSIVLLEDGSLGIEATYNIRRVEARVSLHKSEYEYNLEKIGEIGFFYNEEICGDEVVVAFCIRPHFRVNFNFCSSTRLIGPMRILGLSMPRKKRRSIVEVSNIYREIY